MKFFICGIYFLLHSSPSFSKENINYEYKQYERFDLGNLEVDGQIIAPGDISVRQRARNRIRRQIRQREDFMDLIKEEVKYQR